MKKMDEIQKEMDDVITRTISGELDVSVINGVGRAVREKTRMLSLQHRTAELQGKLDQLNEFYGLK